MAMTTTTDDLSSIDEAIERHRERVQAAERFVVEQGPVIGEQIRSLVISVEQRLKAHGFLAGLGEEHFGQFFLVAREPGGEHDAVFRVCLDPAEEIVRFGGKATEEAALHLRRVSAQDFDRHVLAVAIAEWIAASFGPRPIEDELPHPQSQQVHGHHPHTHV